MVTKPTGRPRGRPTKPKAIEPKRARGRPAKTLANDPDRYFFAVAQANIDAGKQHGFAERRIADTYVSLRYGRVLQWSKNLEAFALGHPYQVVFKHRLRGLVGAVGEQCAGWLNRNAFRPYADGLRLRLRKIRAKPPSDAHGQYALRGIYG
jgi:hypothetical protein